MAVINTAQKMFPADLVTFTGEIFKEKLHFLCSEKRKHHPLPFKMCRNSKDLVRI